MDPQEKERIAQEKYGKSFDVRRARRPPAMRTDAALAVHRCIPAFLAARSPRGSAPRCAGAGHQRAEGGLLPVKASALARRRRHTPHPGTP